MQDTLAKTLIETKKISSQQVAEAQKLAKGNGGNLALSLVRLGALSELEYGEFLASYYNAPLCDLGKTEIDPSVARMVPSEVATRFQVVPIRRNGRRLTVVMANPSNIFAIDDIKFITGLEVDVMVAPEPDIKKALDRMYDQAESLASVMKDLDTDLEVVEEPDEQSDSVAADIAAMDQAPVVKLVNSMMADAVRKGASDIHVEPYEKQLRVRYRIDGVLQEMMSPPYRMKAAIISRLKIMADLDIAERRVPQDGRIKIKIFNKMIDLRVSCLPTIFGEKIVMRILDKSNLTLDLTRAGFEAKALDNLLRAIAMPFGMVLVTGPTGSGKTTTLYSALSKINVPEVNIMTAEDPVEYNIEGINQVNVNEDIGLTFAASLRAFLRQDPNIVMVGEIRDLETASIAVKAALTGHLVLSTLHTNDAPSTLNRMVDMGIEPFLVASSVNLIMAQRLIRRVCTNCKQVIKPHDEVLIELGVPESEWPDFKDMHGAGCIECGNSGYKGRTGVMEVMPISAGIRDMILDRAPTSEIKRQAVVEGMLTLRMDGIRKLKQGLTSAEEVLRETALDK
ncbi:MAG: type IV-A pilus assembly ATPase PilB [Candidatus Eisenbacteria bacterium]|nr:type IV-A pilus assembly ATPase PilB [Candidatus Eisenbacteria bacterium]